MKPLSFSPDDPDELAEIRKATKGFVDYDELAEKEGLRELEFIPGKERIVGFDENVDDFESSDYDRDDYDDYDDYDDCGEDC